MLSKLNCNTLGWKTVPFIFILDLCNIMGHFGVGFVIPCPSRNLATREHVARRGTCGVSLNWESNDGQRYSQDIH